MTNIHLGWQEISRLRRDGYEVEQLAMLDNGRFLCRVSQYAIEHMAALAPSQHVTVSNDRVVSGAMLDAAAMRLGIIR